LTTLPFFGDIFKNLFHVGSALPILSHLTCGDGRRKNGTKAGLALSIASGEEWVFDEDFSQDSKRGDRELQGG